MPATEFLSKYYPENYRETLIWRYMDLDKFSKMLNSSTIWFSRVDKFDDLFEGSISELTNKILKYGSDVTPEMIKHFNKVQKWQQQWTYTTCWHNAPYENALMWRAYAPKGIVVKSKYYKLVEQLDSNAVIGPVLYKNYNTDIVAEGTQMRYYQKRHNFIDEREVRALISEFPEEDIAKTNSALGKAIKVDLSKLIDNIVCRPFADISEFETIKKMVSDAGLKIQVVESELSGDPIL